MDVIGGERVRRGRSTISGLQVTRFIDLCTYMILFILS